MRLSLSTRSYDSADATADQSGQALLGPSAASRAEDAVQRVQRQLPAVLCVQRNLYRAEGGTVRAYSAGTGTGTGNQRLCRSIGHKCAVLADPEAEWHGAVQAAIAALMDDTVPLPTPTALRPSSRPLRLRGG